MISFLRSAVKWTQDPDILVETGFEGEKATKDFAVRGFLKSKRAEDRSVSFQPATNHFTYDRRISRLATIQENKLNMCALDKEVLRERLVKNSKLNIATLKEKTRLLY